MFMLNVVYISKYTDIHVIKHIITNNDDNKAEVNDLNELSMHSTKKNQKPSNEKIFNILLKLLYPLTFYSGC